MTDIKEIIMFMEAILVDPKPYFVYSIPVETTARVVEEVKQLPKESSVDSRS